MLFALLVFLAAFSIEGIGTYVSVVGLSALFASNPVVMILAIALDFGKVVAVSFLYKYWKKLNLPMKIYMTAATAVLITITSTGAFGFLSGEFQKAIADTGVQDIKIATLTDEQGRLQKRKTEIDSQISQLATVNNTAKVTRNDNRQLAGKTALIKQFAPEVERINARLTEIDKELPDLKVKNIDKEIHVGPIIYIAKAFDTTPEVAVKYVILTIIFVFDPLAISLLIAGNFLIELRKRPEEAQVVQTRSGQHVIIEPGKDDVIVDEQPENPPSSKIAEVRAVINAPPVPLEEDQVTKEQIDLQLMPMTEPLSLEPIESHPSEEKPVELEPIQEHDSEITPIEALVRQRRIKMKEQAGRDVISLEEELPPSILDSISGDAADISPYDLAFDKQTMRLAGHYEDNNPPELVTTR